MPLLSILILYILGISIVYLLSPRFNLLERIGLAFPIGLGVMSFYVYVISSFSIAVTRASILIGLCLMIVCLLFFIVKRAGSFRLLFDFSAWKDDIISRVKNIQIIWLIGLGVVVYVLYAVSVKSLFWPTIHYDSIAGYDLLAKAIFNEQELNNSVFDLSNKVCSYRTLYPPLFPIGFAYAYIMGFALAKVITTLFTISLAIVFYAFIRKIANPVSSMFFLLFVLITPEMLAQSAMLMTNVPQAVYTLGGVGAFFLYWKTNEHRYFGLSSLMCALGVWGRTEGIVFAATVGFFLLILIYSKRKECDLFSKNNIKQILIFAVPSLVLFVLWEVFLKVNALDVLKQPFSVVPFYDKEKMTLLIDLTKKITFETTYYGYIINIFFIVIGLSIVQQAYKRTLDSYANMWVLYIFITVFLYLLVYYQIQVPLGAFRGYILNGYKRGLFNFIPLMALYMAASKPCAYVFDKLYFPRNS